MKVISKFVFAIAIFLFSQTASAGTERLIDVDGTTFRVWTEGLASRKTSQPVLVFENGATSKIESWKDFPERAADLGPVIVYDRSTLGKSEWDGEIGTPEHVTANLWALLQALDVKPPYVLIGWSWGGDLAVQHARVHPDDVTGLVLIDPPMHSGSAELDVLRDIGVAPSAHLESIVRMRAEMADAPDAMRADVLPILSIFEKLTDPKTDLHSDISIAALVAGRRADPRPEDIERFGPFPYDFQTHHEAKTRNRVGRLADLVFASGNGALFVLPNEGHALHRYRPDLVLEAIKHVISRQETQ